MSQEPLTPSTFRAAKELRIVARLKNNRLIELREALGLTPKQFAERVDCSYSRYLDLEGLRLEPWIEKGGWRPIVLKLAEFHRVPPDYLFPEALRKIRRTIAERRFDAEERFAVQAGLAHELTAASSPAELLDAKEQKQSIAQALATLTPREQLVLRARYGMDDEPKTLDEVADEVGVSRERLRQIEGKALRKMRYPSRARILLQFVDTSYNQRRTQAGADVSARVAQVAAYVDPLAEKRAAIRAQVNIEYPPHPLLPYVGHLYDYTAHTVPGPQAVTWFGLLGNHAESVCTLCNICIRSQWKCIGCGAVYFTCHECRPKQLTTIVEEHMRLHMDRIRQGVLNLIATIQENEAHRAKLVNERLAGVD